MELSAKGAMITQMLPRDYNTLATSQPQKFRHIILKTLNPIDIILTKINRSKPKDLEDMKILVKKYNIKKENLMSRYQLYEESFKSNVDILRKNFKLVLEVIYNP